MTRLGRAQSGACLPFRDLCRAAACDQYSAFPGRTEHFLNTDGDLSSVCKVTS